MQLFVNNLSTALASEISAASDTITIDDISAAKLVGLGSGDYYLLTLVERDGLGKEIAWEIVKATGVTGQIVTVVRAQEGTTAVVWPAGTTAEARLTAGSVITRHDALAARTEADQHTIEAITGLRGELDGLEPLGAADATVAAHVAAADPHPQYLTETEGDTRYERGLVAGTNITIDRTNPAAPVINAAGGGGGGGGAVDSVNGQTGVVVLDTDDIDEGATNLYFTNARASAAAPVQTVDGQTGAVSLSASYAPLSHVGDTGAAHGNASTSVAGFMSGADKTKLDGIAAGANNYVHPNHTGDVTSVGDGAQTIVNNAVTNAKLADMATQTIKGRTTAGTGDPEDLTAAQVRALLGVGQLAGLPSRAIMASGPVTPADAGHWLICNSATPITLTIGAEATASWAIAGILPMFHILQIGAGDVTVAGDGFSVTLHATDTNVLDGAGAAAVALWRATNTWSLIGRLVAA